MSRIIKLDSKNFNRHTPEGMELLEKSISEVGAIESITIDADGVVITGNARKETFDKLGYKPKFIELGEKEYLVIQTDLTGEKRVKAAIYANTVAQRNIDLDMDLIQEVAIDEYELEFEDLGLDIETVELEAHEDDFDEAPPENPITKLGDLYEIGPHRLLCGDSTDSEQVAKLMNGEKADMVFTDPPYNVAFNGRSGKFDVIENDDLPENEFEELINGFASILSILSPKNYYVWCNWKFYGILQSKIEFKACIVWAKNVFGLGNGYRHQHEFCLFNGKLDEGINNESDLWEIAKDTNYQHPTQKPIALASRALNNHKNNKIIVDLFSGSGSTMVASHQLKRKCYGMELDPKYCDVIVKRMLKLDNSLAVKRNGIDVTKEFISAGTVDYTDGEDRRPNLLKGHSSVKSEAHESLVRG